MGLIPRVRSCLDRLQEEVERDGEGTEAPELNASCGIWDMSLLQRRVLSCPVAAQGLVSAGPCPQILPSMSNPPGLQQVPQVSLHPPLPRGPTHLIRSDGGAAPLPTNTPSPGSEGPVSGPCIPRVWGLSWGPQLALEKGSQQCNTSPLLERAIDVGGWILPERVKSLFYFLLLFLVPGDRYTHDYC